jgi:hypothetical protein
MAGEHATVPPGNLSAKIGINGRQGTETNKQTNRLISLITHIAKTAIRDWNKYFSMLFKGTRTIFQLNGSTKAFCDFFKIDKNALI